jgi:hypothetical protein
VGTKGRKPPLGCRFWWPLGSDQSSSPLPGIFNKDLLSTLHLLVALARHFQPDLALPTNVQVEVIIIEVSSCLRQSRA